MRQEKSKSRLTENLIFLEVFHHFLHFRFVRGEKRRFNNKINCIASAQPGQPADHGVTRSTRNRSVFPSNRSQRLLLGQFKSNLSFPLSDQRILNSIDRSIVENILSEEWPRTFFVSTSRRKLWRSIFGQASIMSSMRFSRI